MQTKRLPATLDSLEPLRLFAIEQARQSGAPEALIPRIELVLEEIMTNQVFHAYRDTPGDAEVGCMSAEDGFCMEFADWGPAFDPLKRPPPDLSKPLEERQIGGLGIHLVKNIADRLEYRREGDRNILKVCFKIDT